MIIQDLKLTNLKPRVISKVLNKVDKFARLDFDNLYSYMMNIIMKLFNL